MSGIKLAIVLKNPEIVKVLLQFGAALTDDILHMAVKVPDLSRAIWEMLLMHSPPALLNARDSMTGKTALHVAVERKVYLTVDQSWH